MGHHTLKNGYQTLVERLNKAPQGAPPSKVLYKILELLFSEEEAKLVTLLPIKPFTARDASKLWKVSITRARNSLEKLSSRAILLDIEYKGEQYYVLPPPMAGFFEFSLMRLNGVPDKKILSELYHQYLNVEEDFVKELFTEGETQLGRVFVNETVLTNENAGHILDYERASEIIKQTDVMGVGTCYCRHKMHHMGKACNAPMEICMTFGQTAASLIKHGHAKKVESSEGLELLHKAYEHNLVQFGENVRENVSFICNCCGCCCEAMLAAKRFALLNPVHTSNYIPKVDESSCTGCGKCVDVCPVESMAIVSASDPSKKSHKKAKVLEDTCLGCGVCARVCSSKSINLLERSERVITPLDTAHRTVIMAIERGKLQHLIFDNQAMFSHRAMAAILGAILRLPPLKRTLANKQIKSRYLESLMVRMKKMGLI